MVTGLKVPMPSKKRKAEPPPPDERPDGRDPTTTIQCFRDVAEWLADVAKTREREYRRVGKLVGQTKYGVADLIDPFLRPLAYRLYWLSRNPGKGPEDVPPAPPPPRPPKVEGEA